MFISDFELDNDFSIFDHKSALSLDFVRTYISGPLFKARDQYGNRILFFIPEKYSDIPLCPLPR